MSPKHDLFNIIAHEQGVSLESSAPKLVFDYSMYGAPKSFYPKLITNSIARDPEVSHPFTTAAMCWYCIMIAYRHSIVTQPQEDSREWSHSLLEAISIITSGALICPLSILTHASILSHLTWCMLPIVR